MAIESAIPWSSFLIPSIVLLVIIIIIFRKYIGDILFETLVDGGLSFLDEILGIGLLPGGDIGDLIAAFIMFKREVTYVGYFAAIVAALEAVNFIFLSFIPGADYITNVFPITPFLRMISSALARVFPDSSMFKGTIELTYFYRKRYHHLLQEVGVGLNLNSPARYRKMAEKAIKREKWSKAWVLYKKAIAELKQCVIDQELDKPEKTLMNRLQKYQKDPGFMQYLPQEGLSSAKLKLLFDKFHEQFTNAKDMISRESFYDGIHKAKGAFKEMGIIEHYHKQYQFVKK